MFFVIPSKVNGEFQDGYPSGVGDGALASL